MLFQYVPSAIAPFDRTPTLAIIALEIVIILGTIGALFILSRLIKRVVLRYVVIAAGVIIFQIFTAPMWNNAKLGPWAYFYLDVSWILTLEWATLILLAVVLVDHFLPRWKEWQRFCLYILALTVAEALIEGNVLVGLGIRSYSPEVMNVIGNRTLPVLNVSPHVFYYVPVFMALVVAFYKYWSWVIDGHPAEPSAPRNWLKTFIISFIGVFLFEMMIEPMVVNARLPAWSYFYRDISFLMTGLWVVIIWLSVGLVDLFLGRRLEMRLRFALYLALVSVIAFPIESWFINNGFRVYGPSAVANFSGLNTRFTGIPIEVAFAIPLYMALIICFIRYWERITGKAKAQEVKQQE